MTDVCNIGTKEAGGSYGAVYYLAGTNYVTKVYSKPRPEEHSEIESTAEIDILFRVRSRFLVEGRTIIPRGECKGVEGFAVQMERLTGRSTTLSGKVDYILLKRVLLHYALGLRCLHRQKYLHLDISVNNCMYGGPPTDPVGKLIDFGLSLATERGPDGRLLPITTKQLRITVTYRPIEAFRNSRVYTDRSDIWSLGMVYLQLLSQQRIVNYDVDRIYYPGTEQKIENINYDAMALREIKVLTDPKTIRANLEKRLEPIPLSERKLATDLLVRMLDQNPATRIGIDEVIASLYFDDIRGEVKESGEGCLQKPVSAMQSDIPFGLKHLAGLRHLITILRKSWSEAKTDFLFNAIDIYMRIVAGIGPQAEIPQITNLATLAALISHRLFYAAREIPQEYVKSGAVAIWEHEGAVLRQLGGMLRRPYLYDMCRSLEELRYVYGTWFEKGNLDNLNGCLRIDLKAYADEVHSTVKGTTNKVTYIETFFTLTVPTPAKIPPTESKINPSAIPPTESKINPSAIPPTESKINPSAIPPVESKINPSAIPPVESKINPSAVPTVESKINRSDLDAAYEYLIGVLTGPFISYSSEFFFRALDIFITMAVALMAGADIPVRAVWNRSSLTNLAVGAMLTAYIQTYKTEEGIPSQYSRAKLPVFYREFVDPLLKVTNDNPFYATAVTLGELSLFYDQYLRPKTTHYTIFDVYPSLKPDLVVSTLRASHRLITEPKQSSIQRLFSQGPARPI